MPFHIDLGYVWGKTMRVYSYFMLQQAIVQNIFPEVPVPTWQAIARGEAEGYSVSSRYRHRGEKYFALLPA